MGAKPPDHWGIYCNFLEKMDILMRFELHFADFHSHLKQQNF